MHCVRTSGKALVAAVALALSLCACNSALAQGWVSPSTFADPESKWINEPRAIDGNTSNYSEDRSSRIGVGGRLELFFSAPLLTSKVAVLADWGPEVDKVIVDIKPYDTQVYETVHSGPVPNVQWKEINFSQRTIVAMRVAFSYKVTNVYYWLWEARAYGDSVNIVPPLGLHRHRDRRRDDLRQTERRLRQ